MSLPFVRACALGLTLAMGLGFSSAVSAWAAYHDGNYYHGGGYGGYHGAYYGGYHGAYYGYHGYGYGAWGAPGYVGAGCRYVQTCYATGCIDQRICY